MNAILGISSEPNVVPLRLSGVDARPESLEAVLCALAADGIELRSIVRTADQVSIVVPAASLMSCRASSAGCGTQASLATASSAPKRRRSPSSEPG